jgi:hypothetical protein
MAFGRMEFDKMTFGRMAFGRMAFGRMAFGRMAFGRMAFGRMAFDKMTLNHICSKEIRANIGQFWKCKKKWDKNEWNDNHDQLYLFLNYQVHFEREKLMN